MAVDWQILYKHADLGKNARVLNYRFIGGGYQNCMDTAGGGTQFNVIGGGFQNKVCVDAFFSSIFSGEQNCVQGQYSVILGGSGNSDNGIPFTGMYANGLTASVAVPGAPSAFWVDQLVMANVVVDTTGAIWPTLPAGTLYTTVAGPSVWGGRPIFVK